jgi:GDP-L-fucose synthase
LIPCNLYGLYDKVDEQKSHYLTALIGKIIQAQNNNDSKINLLGTGKPLRQFMYAEDLARVIKFCIDNDLYQSFNVATDENRSIKEIAEIAIDALDIKNLEIVFDQTSPDGQYRKDVSNEKLKSLIPDFEFTPLKIGINKVYSYYKEHNIV